MNMIASLVSQNTLIWVIINLFA